MEVLERFEQDDLAFEALFRQFEGEVYGWIVRIVRGGGIDASPPGRATRPSALV
jgi:hypothetical protein